PPNCPSHFTRMIREAGGEMEGAIHRHQPRLEQVADLQAVHLPVLGDVEVLARQGVAHPHLAVLGARKDSPPAAILVQAEPRLRAAEQDVLVLGRQLRALLAQVAFHRRGAVSLLAIEEEPVEKGLHPRLVGAVLLVHLPAGLLEILLLAADDLVHLRGHVREQAVDLGLDHVPSIICMNRRKRYRLSCGPGLSSGWYCTANMRRSGAAMPSTVPSYRLMCVTWTLPSSDLWSTAKPWFCEVRSILSPMTSRTGWFAPRWPNFSLY